MPRRVQFAKDAIAVLTVLRQPTNHNKRKVQLHRVIEYQEPFQGAWIAEEDEVETYKDGVWYYATVLAATGQGDYKVQYFDRKIDTVDRYSIRPFAEYEIGEKLQCFVPSTRSFESCVVEHASWNGLHYTVHVNRLGKNIRLKLGYLRRQGRREKAKYQFKGANYHEK